MRNVLDIRLQRILIIDFGSQYAQLIARRVRELGVYCELKSYSVSAQEIIDVAPDGIILSGGPNSVTAENAPQVENIIFELGCPVLGICYGMQVMAMQLGGKVITENKREFGSAQVEVCGDSKLLVDIEDHAGEHGDAILDVWMSHGDQVVDLPSGFKIVAKTNNTPIAVMEDGTRKFYGLQFHPEVTHTKQGARILQHFVHDICGCEVLWTTENIIAESIENIINKVGSDKVVLGLSGGVDSAVAAMLLHKAIKDQLICIFVNTGLLRENEEHQVKTMFEQHFGINLICVDAKEQFLTALAGVADPEEKRKIIGREFINVFELEAKKITNVKWLAQGTIYPDVIESAINSSHVIKSHHNVGGLPEKMQLKLIEPLGQLFKDEVRKLGLELGLPYDMVYRHPFPGPGLGVRILGEVRKEYLDLLRKVDVIFLDELYKNELYHRVSQAFAVFLPVRSVGVLGDARHFNYVIALRAVTTEDFMTASWAQLPHEFLNNVSTRIINEVAGISRVVYDISGKPPATIEWE